MSTAETIALPSTNHSEATTSRVRQFLSLVTALSVTEFKLRYYGSVLGYFWTLARPLMLFGVLYVVFTHIVKVGASVSYYPVVLLTAIVLWTFFSDATSAAVQSLTNRDNLVRTMSFPLAAIPIASALTAAFNLGLNLIAVFIFMMISGVPAHPTWLEGPVIVLGLVLFSLPVTMLLSVLYVRFRDMQHIWEIALQLGFWGTPIIYPIEVVPHKLQRVMMCNPVAALLEQARHAIIDPAAPSAAAAIGGQVFLLIPLTVAIAVFAIGIVVFHRQSPHIAELL